MLNRASFFPRALFQSSTWLTALMLLAFAAVATAIVVNPVDGSARQQSAGAIAEESSNRADINDVAATIFFPEAAVAVSEPELPAPELPVYEGAHHDHSHIVEIASAEAPVSAAETTAAAEPEAAPAATEYAVAEALQQAVAVDASPAESAPQAAISAPAPAAPAAPAASGNVILWGAEYWDAVSLANVRQALALLPAHVQAQLGNPAFGPLKILVNWEGRTASGYQPYGQAANFFSTNEGTNEVVLYPQQPVFTIVHELAHAYNLRNVGAGNYAGVLLDPEMQSFMAIAGWQVLATPQQIASTYDHWRIPMTYSGAAIWDSLSREDPLEDFANSFAQYFTNPGGLYSLSPERYGWFAERF